jgi:hypothetical protein
MLPKFFPCFLLLLLDPTAALAAYVEVSGGGM